MTTDTARIAELRRRLGNWREEDKEFDLNEVWMPVHCIDVELLLARLEAAVAVVRAAEKLSEYLPMRHYYESNDVQAFWACGACNEQTDGPHLVGKPVNHLHECDWLLFQNAIAAYRTQPPRCGWTRQR